MKNPMLSLLATFCFLSGCTATARLYPVQGELSTHSPNIVYVAKFHDGLKSGDLLVQTNKGETYKGKWVLVRRPKKPSESVAAVPPDNLSKEWDTVYGPDFYVSHVLGSRLYGHAVLTGSGGATLKVEIYRSDNTEENIISAVKGVAKDDSENIFKVAF